MNPLAVEINEQIKSSSPCAFACLSELGQKIYFPKGILSQSAEAKEKAHRFNATIGIATENGEPMYLPVTKKYLQHLAPADIYPYAPPAGRPKLRTLWREKMILENPALKGKDFSVPVVTNALTHGLSLVADLFVNAGDVIITPDKLWGNYRLTYETMKGGTCVTYPMFTEEGGFNVKGLEKSIKEQAAKKEKIIVLLNFPNNPTGYTPSVEEAQGIVAAIKAQAEAGTKIVTISDDAYFGLFFENSIKESLFGFLCNLHENILAIKLDGATKEDYAWGFRTGFISLGTKTSNPGVLFNALEAKVKGNIRGTISNCPHPSQSIVEKMLEDKEFDENRREKFRTMCGRANRLKEVLKQPKFDEAWSYYPFNSGYFMCLKLKRVDAEELRLHLLNNYGIGTISIGKTDLRVAFSCIEEDRLAELFDFIYQAECELAA